MCQFLSAVVLKNGDLKMHPMLDSHADIIRYFKLPDTTAHHQHFAKVELTPVDWMDVSTWTFRLDEETKPGWWDDVAEGVEAELRRRADKMILRDGEHGLIVDGCWIVGGTAKVRDIRSGRIIRVQDNAFLEHLWDSATVQDVGGSATVQHVRDSATVQYVGGSATVQHVRGSATVQDVWGSATLDESAKAHFLVKKGV